MTKTWLGIAIQLGSAIHASQHRDYEKAMDLYRQQVYVLLCKASANRGGWIGAFRVGYWVTMFGSTNNLTHWFCVVMFFKAEHWNRARVTNVLQTTYVASKPFVYKGFGEPHYGVGITK